MSCGDSWRRHGAFGAALQVVVLIAAACSSPVPSLTASPEASEPQSSAPSPSETPPPTAPQATAYTNWQRIDLPDPAPDVYGGGLPSSVVAVESGYLAVGTINASCCADGDPSLNSGIVWTSPEGRRWEVNSDIAAFEHASLRRVLLVGNASVGVGLRLFAIGSYAEPVPGGQGVSVPAIWTSSDGLTWTRIKGAVPDLVARGGPGLVGFDGAHGRAAGRRPPTFMQSTDGLTWKVVSDPIAGGVEDLIATPDGGALAIGFVDGPPAPDGGPTSDAVGWHSADGLAWTGPTAIATRALAMSVVAGAPGYLAVGSDDQAAALWSSSDGVSWRQGTIGTGDEDTLAHIFAVPGGFLVDGDTTLHPQDVANQMLWFSTDGLTWGRVPDQDAFVGINNDIASLIATSDGVLAVGSRWDSASGHAVPQAWLASR